MREMQLAAMYITSPKSSYHMMPKPGNSHEMVPDIARPNVNAVGYLVVIRVP